MKTHYARLVLFSSTIAAVAQVSPGFAQGLMLEEVLVTAQKREQSADEIAMAISAFSGEDLRALGMTDTSDVASLVPGFTFAKSRSGMPIYTLRGVGFNSDNFSSTSPVGIYIDEVAFAYPYMGQGLNFDLERVEVLKGPQGTLYGRNTTGGLVNFITNRPTEEFEASIKLEYGSFDSYGGEMVVSGPLTENLKGRLAVKTDQSDQGWQRSVSRAGDTLGKKDRTGARLALDWELSSDLSAQFTVGWWEDRSDTQAPQVHALSIERPGFEVPGIETTLIPNPDNRDADWDRPEPLEWGGTTWTEPPDDFVKDAEMYGVSARFDWYFNDRASITSLTSFQDVKRADLMDRDGTQFEMPTYLDSGTIESFSQELRVSGSTDNFKYIGGLYYSNDKLEDRSSAYGGEASVLERLRFIGGTVMDYGVEAAYGFRSYGSVLDIENESKAVFGQIEWSPKDAVNLTAGLRYTRDEIDYAGCTGDQNGDGNIFALWNPLFQGAPFNFPFPQGDLQPGQCLSFLEDFSSPSYVPTVDSLNEENVSGSVGIDWTVRENNLFYATYKRGFKSGNFPQSPSNVVTQLFPAKQEQLDAWEVGLKTRVYDNAQINLAAYHYNYKDKQAFADVLDPVFVTLVRLVNIPKSEVTGAEIDFTWAVTERLLTRVSASYIDTEITEFTGFDKSGNPQDFAGSEFEYSPETQLNFLASYSMGLWSDLTAQITLDARYTSDQQGDYLGSPEFTVDSYTLWGLNVDVVPASEQWEVAMWARNLTDEYYWNSVQKQTDTIFRYTGMPRTWGMSFQYNLR